MAEMVEAMGVVCGVSLMAILFALQKDVQVDDLRKLMERQEDDNGVVPVEATPELEAFLIDNNHAALLKPLKLWGARTVADLKFLGDDDLIELGVPDDDWDFRKALADLQ